MTTINKDQKIIKIEKVDSIEDLPQCFECLSTGFDEEELFNAINPNHKTKEGKERAIERIKGTWLRCKDNEDFHFIKAVLYDDEDQRGKKEIVGYAMWTTLSLTKTLTPIDATVLFDLEKLYPNDPTSQEWVKQVWKEAFSHRRKVVLDGGQEAKPVLGLDILAVRSDMHRRGIGMKLAKWGVDYAKEIGAREAVVEASASGLGCYKKVGFSVQEVMNFHASVDPALEKLRRFPTITFMRTGPLSES